MTATANQPPETMRPHRLPLGPTAQTLALGFCLVLLAGALRSTDESGIDRDRFWINKIRWQGVADVVIAGDSRSYLGVAPAHLAPYLGNARVYNFGFDAAGFYGRYLDAAERLLDPQSTTPRFILCVTPRSLTPEAEGFNGFRAFVGELRTRSWLELQVPEFFSFFKPMDAGDLWHGIFPFLKKRHFYREYHADGWMAGDRVPPKFGFNVEEYQNRVFVKNTVDPARVEELLTYVQRWTARGIRVYSLRPPTCKAMLKVEQRLSGFDEDGFVKAFTAAGGVWLPTDQTGYLTFDDSHLRRDDAIRFTNDLGRQLQAIEEGRPAPAPAP
jgi:hypothetical protein